MKRTGDGRLEGELLGVLATLVTPAARDRLAAQRQQESVLDSSVTPAELLAPLRTGRFPVDNRSNLRWVLGESLSWYALHRDDEDCWRETLYVAILLLEIDSRLPPQAIPVAETCVGLVLLLTRRPDCAALVPLCQRWLIKQANQRKAIQNPEGSTACFWGAVAMDLRRLARRLRDAGPDSIEPPWPLMESGLAVSRELWTAALPDLDADWALITEHLDRMHAGLPVRSSDQGG